MVKLTQLENALALETHGNFYRAAAAQNISQPAFSRSIQKLEESMGVILFNRDPERVVPTDAGQLLLSRARTIVGEAVEMQHEIQMLHGLEMGHVSISMGVYPAELSGCRAIGELIRLHPKVSVQSNIHEWRFIIRQVLERSVDLVPSVELDNLTMVREIVERSDAFGTTTLVQIEPWLKSGSIGILPFRRRWLKLDYGFIYLRQHQLSPAAKLFMELTKRIETRLARRNKELMGQMFRDSNK